MFKLFNMMVSDGITPNNLYVLFMLNRKEIPKLVNLNAEMRLLKLEEFITESNTITLKGLDVLKKYEEFLKPLIELYHITRKYPTA